MVRNDRRLLVLGGACLAIMLVVGLPAAHRWMSPRTTVVIADLTDDGTPIAPGVQPAAHGAGSAEGPGRDNALRKPVDSAAQRTVDSSGAKPPIAASKRQLANKANRSAQPPAYTVAPRIADVDAAAIAAAAPPAVAALAPPPTAPIEPEAQVPTGPVFELNQVDQRPQIASQTEPRLPEELRDRPLSDVVIVRVLVSQSGRPSQINLLRRSKTGPTLDAAVVTAVRQWTFSPARKRGQAVSCWYNIGVPFRSDGISALP